MTPTGNISAIALTTDLYGREAIDTLVQFAPDEIRPTLMKYVFSLDWLLADGTTVNLGVGGGSYEWYLKVCDTPSPRVQLRVLHAVLRHMPITEGLEIERDALNRAHPEVRDMVEVYPIDIPDYDLREYIWDNLRNGHHWAHGLS